MFTLDEAPETSRGGGCLIQAVGNFREIGSELFGQRFEIEISREFGVADCNGEGITDFLKHEAQQSRGE